MPIVTVPIREAAGQATLATPLPTAPPAAETTSSGQRATPASFAVRPGGESTEAPVRYPDLELRLISMPNEVKAPARELLEPALKRGAASSPSQFWSMVKLDVPVVAVPRDQGVSCQSVT